MAAQAFTLDHLLRLQQPTSRVPLHLSPDGVLLAVSAQGMRRDAAAGVQQGFTGAGIPLEMVGSRVLVVDTTTGATTEPFAAPQSTSWGAQWSPDGRLLAAYVQQGGPACLGIWQRGTGAVRLYRDARIRMFFGFEVPRWTPDGRFVVVKLVPARGPALADRTQGAAGDEDARVTVFSFDPDAPAEARAVPPRFERDCGDLARVDVLSGRVDTLVGDGCGRGWRVAPDGSAVAMLRIADVAEERQQLYYDLAVAPLGGGQPRTVATAVPQRYGVSFNWSPDGRRIAYTTAERGRVGRLFVVAADGTGAPVALADAGGPSLAQEYEAPRWSDDGRFVYCLARDGVWEFAADGGARRRFARPEDRTLLGWVQPPAGATLWRGADDSILQVVRDPRAKTVGLARVTPPDERGTVLVEAARYWSAPTFGVEAVPDGSAAYLVLESADHPPGVWRLRGDFRAPRRLFSFNQGLDDVALGASRLVTWRALDGEQRRGALLLPADYTEGRRVPVVVDIYGGNWGSDQLHRFGCGDKVINGHLLASRGYGVLYPDLPLTDRDPLRQLVGGVLPALNRLVALGIADPDRLGVMGHSYGAYCVAALLTQTRRFKAAAASAGFAINLTSHYGILTVDGDSQWLGWAESGQGRLGGSLWERRDAYIENSPLFYLDRVETPLLLVSGTAYPGEAAQAGEAFSALRRLGKRVELRLYQGEEHWPGRWSEHSFRDLCGRVLEWFDEYLRP